MLNEQWGEKNTSGLDDSNMVSKDDTGLFTFFGDGSQVSRNEIKKKQTKIIYLPVSMCLWSIQSLFLVQHRFLLNILSISQALF